MAARYGKCTNFGLCAKADTRENQNVPETADFVCIECKRPLTPIGGTGDHRRNQLSPLLWIVALLLLLIGGGAYFFTHLTHRSSSQTNETNAGAGPTHNAAPVLRLSGSNTIGSQLGPDLAQAWLAARGANDIHRVSNGTDETTISGTQNGEGVSIVIKAHGTATAFTDLGANACDIGMASRKIKSQEQSELLAKGLGDVTSNADERVVGLDGVAVIVNEASGKDVMTKDQVADIFAGSSPGQTWNIYARDDKSGTYDTFKDRVLGTRSLVSSAKRLEDSKALANAVAQDRQGIGFVGLPYAVGVKVLAIAEKGATPLIPNTMTVRTEAYPLSRRLYFYVPDNTKRESREFVQFALSPQGQDIVEKDGFVGQKVEPVKVQTPANAPQGYLALMPSADRLSVDFRFRTGSSELDTKAVDDIKRMAAAMTSQFSGRGVMLVGFADSTGNPPANLRLSKDRAQAVAGQMSRQGITPVFVTGFGQELPVADNGSLEGREKNRRVEVWLRK